MKPLACIVGRHNWTTVREQGQSYQVCSDCGKMPKPRGGLDSFSAHDQRDKDLGSPYK